MIPPTTTVDRPINTAINGRAFFNPSKVKVAIPLVSNKKSVFL
jgi:hypothetical protein